ncbi:MAG: choice-of-anchor D domain-containing protein, partial [Candidatus Latescibacterota bacterium]
APTQTGTFSGDIVLQHTNTGVPKLKLEFIEVAVSGRVFPSISLGQNSLDFGQVDLDKKIEKVVTIHNAGPGVLAVSDIQSDVAGIVISEKQCDIPANGSKDIKVSYQPSSEGAFSGLIQVMSDDPDHAIMSVSLTGTGVFVPADARTDFDGSGKVDFADFLVFAQAFGSTNVLIDVDGSGKVDFADFLTFAQSFGKSVSK